MSVYALVIPNLICEHCHKQLLNPVTLNCGHAFCNHHFLFNGIQVEISDYCPVCSCSITKKTHGFVINAFATITQDTNEQETSYTRELEKALDEKTSIKKKLEKFFAQQDEQSEFSVPELMKIFNCTNSPLSRALSKLEFQGKIVKNRKPKLHGSYNLFYSKSIDLNQEPDIVTQVPTIQKESNFGVRYYPLAQNIIVDPKTLITAIPTNNNNNNNGSPYPIGRLDDTQ